MSQKTKSIRPGPAELYEVSLHYFSIIPFGNRCDSCSGNPIQCHHHGFPPNTGFPSSWARTSRRSVPSYGNDILEWPGKVTVPPFAVQIAGVNGDINAKEEGLPDHSGEITDMAEVHEDKGRTKSLKKDPQSGYCLPSCA